MEFYLRPLTKIIITTRLTKIIMKLFKFILTSYRLWNLKRQFQRCQREAARIVAGVKAQYPGCETAMNAWPSTGATGNGNAAAGQYVATGTGTTLLWGTNNAIVATGFLTVTDIKLRTMQELIKLPNGDGLTAGTVQLIDGFAADVEVRDDENQVPGNFSVGSRFQINDLGGIVPGGARGAFYRAIMIEHDWNTAPKTPAGRRLAMEVYLLIA